MRKKPASRIIAALISMLVVTACNNEPPAPNTSAATEADTTASMPAEKAEYSPHLSGDHTPAADDGLRPYFGDTHLHTSYSTDAGMVGANVGPEEAYRFARGEEVRSNSGWRVRLQRPLDFLVIADHAENLGLAPMIAESNPELLATDWGRQVHDLVKAGKGLEAYAMWMDAMGRNTDPLVEKKETMVRPIWHRLTSAAEKYNEPGKFTAIIGFEWTSNPDGNNLHRNVLFREDKTYADQIMPISNYDTSDPEKLWEWMAAYEEKTGGRVLAIPHNGNLSNGLMFDEVTLTTREPLDRDYAERRMRWEPIYETTQPKGDGETHPKLSPNDEFASFERWDRGSFGEQLKTDDMLPREYTREALKRGLVFESSLGVNPFKMGLIGSTDAHTGLATTTEDNFFGKVAMVEPSADEARFNEVVVGRFPLDRAREDQHLARETSASGLAAVWAKSNTREDLWDAMARKEVYATTGTRLRVRVFGGFDFNPSDAERRDFADHGYSTGVPMGGDLRQQAHDGSPSFVIQATRDPDGANLDRIQIVKGWLDNQGVTHEQVYDVSWSEGRQPGADGKLPPVGNTVDVAEASYTNTIGAVNLNGYWQDPQFDVGERAFYYVRVIEIPTPRWTTYDAKFFGVPVPTDVPSSIQDRAYTSPIWYSP